MIKKKGRTPEKNKMREADIMRRINKASTNPVRTRRERVEWWTTKDSRDQGKAEGVKREGEGRQGRVSGPSRKGVGL